MKKHLLKTVLLAVALLLGTTSTWADSTTASAGSDDNSTPWNHNSGGDPVTWYDDWVTQDYKLTGNGTYTFNLTTTNAATADHDYYGWSLFLGKKGWLNIWDHWLVGTSSTGNVWGNGTGTKGTTNDYWTKNPKGAGIYSAMNNSTAVVTVTRTSSYIKSVVKVTPASEKPFTIVWSYYYADGEDATADLYINFAVEYAYVNITSANFESASSVSPTPVYFNDFSSGEGPDIVGDGKFVSDETPGFGQVFENAASNTPRTNYLLLSGAFSDFTYENANTEMTIGFWVNAKNAGDPSNYTYAPLFGAYGSAPNPNNGTPMLCLQSRGLAQLNNNGWCDFTYEQNVAPNAGKNTVYNSNAWDATTSTWGETNGNHVSGGNWLDDKEWHYYTLTLTPRNVIIYLDGEVKNKWVLDGDSDGRNIIGSIVNGSALSYVALGGNQAWGNADNDAAFMFDDFAVYDKALTAEQIATIIADKTPSYSYTVNAVDANNNILKELATGNQPAGEITYAYPRYINVNGTLYLKNKQNTNPNYQGSFNLSSADQVENVTYSPSNFKNIVYFSEAEDVLTSNASTNVVNRCSNLQGGTAASATKITTLPAGTYTIYFAMYAATNRTFSIYKNSTDNVLMSQNGSGGWAEYNTVSFTLDEASDILVQGGDSGYAFDYFFITGTPSHEVVGATDNSTGWKGAKNNTPICINAGETAKYTFVNHNSRAGEIWNNWYLLAKATADANADDVVAIRADQWTDPGVTQSDNTLTENGFNYVSDYDGATVEISIALTEGENSTYTMTATTQVTKADGTEAGSKVDTATGLTQSKLYLYMSVFNSWLELLSEEVGVSMNQYGWATFASDNALDFSNTGLTAYAISGTAGDITVKNEVATTTAEKGLLISGAEGNYLVPVIAPANVDNIDANTLESTLLVRGTGANVEEGTDKANYVLSVYKNSAMFKKIESDPAFVPVNKAYLVLDNGLNAAPKYIGIVGGEATGINNLNVDEENAQADGAIYNLAGQRVSKDYKGLVIMNGKKVIIK